MNTSTGLNQKTLRLSSLQLSRLPTLPQIRDERCRRDPLYWAQHWTCTENPHYEAQGLEFRAPFPQKSYFRLVFDAFAKESKLFIPKSRDMMTSWSALIWATHQARSEERRVGKECRAR